MGFQFIHVEVYGRAAGKGKAGGHSIRSIMAEAGREDGAHPHVAAPQPPALIYGRPLAEVEAEATAWGDQAKDTKGRRLRIDGLCLMAGVISAPDDMSGAAWEAMKRDAIEWLARDGRLASVIEHGDESHRHIHFYKIPEVGKSFETIHPGRAAAARAKSEGQKKGAQNSAYIEAMRAFQDDFFAQVAVRHGLTRIGPAKRRLTRSGWHADQQAAKATAEALRQLDEAKALATTARAEADAAKAVAAEMIRKAREAAKDAVAAADEAKATRAAADKVRQANWLMAKRLVKEKAAMEKVAARIEEEREAVAKLHRRGGWFGQTWAGFVDALHGREAKAEKERAEIKAKLDEAQAEATKEREAREEAERAQKHAERLLEVAIANHRKELAASEAKRLRAEERLQASLGHDFDQGRGPRM